MSEQKLFVLERDIGLQLARSGVFILGHARSGTTVLQNALNDSPDIYLFGEADLYADPGSHDFRSRYNSLQRSLRNQETKSTYCPRLFDEDRDWLSYMVRLLDYYRYVGSKCVFGPESPADACDRLIDFASRYFYRSHFVFAFRDPGAVINSYRKLTEWKGGRFNPKLAIRSYLRVISLYLRMLRNFPFVRAVFQDADTEANFADIGRSLSLDLSQSAKYYNKGKIFIHEEQVFAGDEKIFFEQLGLVYQEFRDLEQGGHSLLQAEQNSANLNPGHATPLGALYRRIEVLIGYLDGSIGSAATDPDQR